MTTAHFTDQRLLRFLLGDVAGTEREAIEARIFQQDDETFAQLEMLEDELRFDYAQNLLPTADRARFEQRLLTTEAHRRRQLLVRGIFSRAEAASVPSRRPPVATLARRWWRHPVMVPALTAAVVVLAVASVFLARARDAALLSAASARNEATNISEQLAAERQRAAALEAQVTAAASGTATLELESGATRTAGTPTPRLDVATAARGVDLVLKLPATVGPSSSYRAVIRDADGHDVWSGLNLAASAGRVHARIPATRLVRADYEVVLRGAAPDGNVRDLATYYFRVVAR